MKKERPGIHEYKLFAEAWYFLAKARLMLVFREFKEIVPSLEGDADARKGSIEELQSIKLSIARACTKSPWRTKCFEQALAAGLMLQRRNIQRATYFGVRKNTSGSIDAHAWLKSGDFIVTGWQQVNTYTVIAEF